MAPRNILVLAASLTGSAILAASALAGGEPKNEWPFTRTVGVRTTQGIASPERTGAVIQGEPKNELPFTRPVGNRATQGITPAAHNGSVTQGEPKDEPPFTRPVTVAVTSSNGFDWASGGIGAATGLGIALTAAGLVLAARKSPRTA